MSYQGTPGNDTYTGDGTDETITGLGGDDTLNGGGGNDTIDGGEGDDKLSGGDGNDTIYSYNGADKLLDGGAGDDNIHLAGVTINGGVLIGGSGLDTLSLDGNVVFNMAKWSAKDAGFENFYNYWGYSITGTGEANRFDFSALTATSRYGVVLYGLGGDDGIIGTGGNDIISGGDDNDSLTGGAGGDTLTGDGGNDSLIAGDGVDSLNGGTGDDTLNGGNDGDNLVGDTGNDTLIGGDGDDTLDGGADTDSLSGGAGNDQLYAYAGADTLLDGGTGDDTVHLAAVSIKGTALVGGTGADTLAIDGALTLLVNAFDFGATGFENLYNYWGYAITATSDVNKLDFSKAVVTSRYGAVVYSLAGNDTLIGSSGNDIFYGGDDTDRLTGNAGADSLYGENGDDTIDAGDGNDAAYGGVGIDKITGGLGDDTLSGETGNDTVEGGDGVDSLNGGDGDDVLTGGDGDDVLDGGNDADRMTGGDGNDQIYLYGGTDLLASGGAGDDTVHLAGVAVNADVISGGTGADTLAIDGAATFAMATFDARAAGFENYYNYWGYAISGTATANRFDFSAITVTSRYGVVLNGLAGTDTLIGSAAADYFNGGDDGDSLTGNAGGDSLLGEAGDDTIDGGDGNDSINGGIGADTLSGGNDIDTINGDAGNDGITGGGGDDVIDGGADADTMSGGDGNDSITLYDGVDLKADGGAGDDTIHIGAVTINAGVLIAGSGIDTLALDNNATLGTAIFDAAAAGFENFYNYWGYSLTGTAAADTYDFSRVTATSRYGAVIYGNGGNDTLIGTGGYDALYGGADNDTLTGNGTGDLLSGDDGDDKLYGGEGADNLAGGIGVDLLDGGTEGDTLAGNAGNDTLIGGAGDDSLDGGADADSMSGGAGNDTIFVTDGTDILADGGADDDHLVIGAVTFGDGVLIGGSGVDLFDLSNNAVFSGRRFAAAEAGFENYYNYWGYRITGTADANTIDFSGLTATSRYGVILDGADGDDTLIGLGANDTLIGGVGDDVLEGGNGDDALTGGDGGVDLASYAGASAKVTVTLAGQGAAQDTLGAGLDTLIGFEGLIGSKFGDTLTGDAGNNRLFGNNGADRLSGAEGVDILQGDAGDDLLIGGVGRDTAAYAARWADYDVVATADGYTVADRRGGGPEGVDTLQGMEQVRYANGTFSVADTINVGPTAFADAAGAQEAGVGVPGVATATGSVLANDTDPNLLTVGLGEVLTVTSVAANGGAAVLVAGPTVLDGVYGTLTIAADGSWTYQIDDVRPATENLKAGETATEVFSYTIADAHGVSSAAALSVVVTGAGDTLARADVLEVTIGQASSLDLAVLTGDDSFGAGTVLSGVANVSGASVAIVDGRLVILATGAAAAFDYTLTAANGETSTAHVDVSGVTYTGRAVLVADPGATAVDFVGGAAGDKLTGGDGMDRLVGNGGADTLVGGAGDDALSGGDSKDVLTGGAGNDLLDGGLGTDTASYAASRGGVAVDLRVAGAQDTGGDGADTLTSIENVTGGGGNDRLTGNDLANVLRGGGGNDTLVGNGGADMLVGGGGGDTLTGGRNADTFAFESLADFGSGARLDRIVDFKHAEGDRIDLSLIDPDAATAGDQGFTFIGAAAFTPGATAFELRYEAAGDGSFLIQADVDHDGLADWSLQVTSATPLVVEDFVL